MSISAADLDEMDEINEFMLDVYRKLEESKEQFKNGEFLNWDDAFKRIREA
ncbi:hypothetical protein AGMMS49975_03720 [Clostridia bacterium]|nr:hypothetical protein AGMMS49975_03720 [Clostridia bacterium]